MCSDRRKHLAGRCTRFQISRSQAFLRVMLSITLIMLCSAIGMADILSIGEQHALAVKGGAVWAWGSDQYGQLGRSDNDPNYSVDPCEVTGIQTYVISVSAGAFHSLALDDEKHVWSWGWNSHGQLGLGMKSDELPYNPTPQLVTGIPNDVNVLAISARENFSLALDENGQVWAWGDSSDLQAGPVNNTVNPFGGIPDNNNYSPALLPFNNTVTIIAIAAGAQHGLAVDDANQLYGWGRGLEGQLISEQPINQAQPLPIPDFDNIQLLAAGYRHSLVADDANQVVAWGDNEFAQLGVDPNLGLSPPILVFDDPNEMRSLAAGAYHNLALDVNDRLWVWGDNTHGQSGVGPNDLTVSIPTVLDINDANVIAAGTSYSLALDETGLAWEWGRLPIVHSEVDDINVPTPQIVPGFPCVLDVNATEGGTVTGPDVGEWIYPLGTRVRPLALAEEHYEFDSWSGSAVDSGWVFDPEVVQASVDIQGDLTLIANFKRALYTLTVQSTKGGRIISPEPNEQDPNKPVVSFRSSEEEIELTVERDGDDYSFVGWELEPNDLGEIADPCSLNTTLRILGDVTVTAVFEGAVSAGLQGPLRAAVVNELLETHGITSTNPNTKDMARLETLDASGQGISDLTGLDYAINLHTLNLNDNQISDINVLTDMPSLRVLQLDSNKGIDLTSLVKDMTNLTVLHLSDVDIDDFTVLGNLVNLEFLVLDNTNDKIEDIPESWLSQLAQLKFFSIRGNAGLRKSDHNVRRLLLEVCRPNGGSIAVDR